MSLKEPNDSGHLRMSRSSPLKEEVMIPLLEVRNLSRRSAATQALRNASLTVNAGQMLCPLGENGASTSTMRNIAAALVTADEGHVLLDGKPITNSRIDTVRKLGLALAYQELS